MKFILFLILLTVLSLSSSETGTLYKWTDKNGVDHYSNKIDNANNNEVKVIDLPNNKESYNNSVQESELKEPDEQQIQSEEDNEISEQKKREYWRGLARSIEEEQEETKYEIKITKQKIEQLKREVDYYLINGYSADYLIYELRNLENRIEPLNIKLELLKEDRLLLKQQARKNGIPPGYLRP